MGTSESPAARRFGREKTRLFATPDNLARGVVVVDGHSSSIALRSELLYVDGLAWFRYQSDRQLDLAEGARRDGDARLAAEMEATSRQITAFSEGRSQLRSPTLGYGVCNRSELKPWSVDDTPEAMRSYARCLIDFGRTLTEGGTDFLLFEAGELLLTERLRPQSRFARPFRATIVGSEEIERRLEEIP